MREDDGFAAAEGWIDEWVSGAADHAARADDLARRLKCAVGMDAVRAAVAQTVGFDSALGRAVVEAYG